MEREGENLEIKEFRKKEKEFRKKKGEGVLRMNLVIWEFMKEGTLEKEKRREDGRERRN